MFVDNESAIKLINYPTLNRGSKHIEIKFHFVRDKVESEEIVVSYVPSVEQLADMLTKVLPKEKYNKMKLFIDMKLR